MKSDKIYIEYDEIPELHSWNAIAKEFTVYTPVYKVMERRSLRKDKMHLITKDAKEAINRVKELRTK
jgi:hypothetical protein